MRALLIAAAALALLAAPLSAQSASLDSLQTELTRASAFNKASATQLTKTLGILERVRERMLEAGTGMWTMILPAPPPWHAVATLPADSGWAQIVLDSAGIVHDSATVWMGPRQ